MTDEPRVLRSVYIPRKIDSKIKQFAFTQGKTSIEIILDLITKGLLFYDSSGEKSIADKMEEDHKHKIEFREKKIAEFVELMNEDFDERWDKIRNFIKELE